MAPFLFNWWGGTSLLPSDSPIHLLKDNGWCHQHSCSKMSPTIYRSKMRIGKGTTKPQLSWTLTGDVIFWHHIKPIPFVYIQMFYLERQAYFGSGGPSERGFMESLQSERNTKNASFWRMWENFAPGAGPVVATDSCGRNAHVSLLRQLNATAEKMNHHLQHITCNNHTKSYSP